MFIHCYYRFSWQMNIEQIGATIGVRKIKRNKRNLARKGMLKRRRRRKPKREKRERNQKRQKGPTSLLINISSPTCKVKFPLYLFVTILCIGMLMKIILSHGGMCTFE